MTYYEHINEGEGIAGPNTIAISTSGLFACMGIAFANKATQMGGLYHYPSGYLQSPAVFETLIQMINDINPTLIFVTPAAREFKEGVGETLQGERKREAVDDLAAVKKFLKEKAPGANVFQMPAKGAAALYWKDGEPVLNETPGSKTEVAAVQPEYRSTLSSAARVVDGNTMYYGGDGQQVALKMKEEKKKKSKNCNIL